MSNAAANQLIRTHVEKGMIRRTVAVVDMVAYSTVAKLLEENISAVGVSDLNDQIQNFMTRALGQLSSDHTHSVIARTGDGIILLFERSQDAHAFAYHVHLFAAEHNRLLSESTAARWFRVGIATGDISSAVSTARPAEYAGTTIANAVRLEAAASPGHILMDQSSFADLPDDIKLLYGPEETVKGKRTERFRVRRCRVSGDDRPAPEGKHLLASRRAVIGTGAALLGAAVLASWYKAPRLEAKMHPLPAKRFVAVLGWPLPDDAGIEPTINAVIDAIATELARAEAFDHDLLTIPHKVSKDTTFGQLKELRESLGANLILATSGTTHGKRLHLTLRVFDATISQSLREAEISIAESEQISLAEKAVRAVIGLLDIKGYKPNQERLGPGTDSSEAYALFQSAEDLRKEENDTGLQAAIAKYKRAVDLDNKYVAAYASLALAYCRMSAATHDSVVLDLARSNAGIAASLDPRSVSAHMALASVASQSGDEAGALVEMKKALAVDPANYGTLIWQAQLYTRLNRWQDAEESFGWILRERPNSWLAHNELGVLYNAQGKYPAALREFQLANRAAPRNTYPLNNIASVSLQLGRVQEALSAGQRSFDINANALAAGTLAAALRTQANYTKARELAKQATQLDPSDSTTWLELGDCCALSGMKKEAADAYAKAQQVQADELLSDSTDGPGYMLLALTTAKSRQMAQVLLLIKEADVHHAGDMDSQLYKARTLEVIGRRSDALKTVRECIARGATRFQIETMPDMHDLTTDPQYLSI